MLAFLEGGPGPNVWNNENKCVFYRGTQVKVSVDCSWRCPGTSAPCLAHLTVSWYLCSCGSNVGGGFRALEGHNVGQKSPFRVQDRDEGVVERNRRE